MTWVSVVMAMFFAASVWFAYLVRIVLNDEVVQERKRRRMRARELERRRQEDRANRKRRR
jgi:lipid A disaccharide synthetase